MPINQPDTGAGAISAKTSSEPVIVSMAGELVTRPISNLVKAASMYWNLGRLGSEYAHLVPKGQPKVLEVAVDGSSRIENNEGTPVRSELRLVMTSEGLMLGRIYTNLRGAENGQVVGALSPVGMRTCLQLATQGFTLGTIEQRIGDGVGPQAK